MLCTTWAPTGPGPSTALRRKAADTVAQVPASPLPVAGPTAGLGSCSDFVPRGAPVIRLNEGILWCPWSLLFLPLTEAIALKFWFFTKQSFLGLLLPHYHRTDHTTIISSEALNSLHGKEHSLQSPGSYSKRTMLIKLQIRWTEIHCFLIRRNGHKKQTHNPGFYFFLCWNTFVLLYSH